jgi:hypothetical protein
VPQQFSKVTDDGLLWRFYYADAPRLSLLRVKAASEDTSASGDELIEDLKAKVLRVFIC